MGFQYKNALIVIDMQNFFVNKNTFALPKKIANFIKANTFDFIIFTQYINKKDSNFFKILNFKNMFYSPDIDIHPAIVEFTNKRNVFQKTTYSIFKSKKLIRFLKKHAIKKLLLCGIDIDACILASAFDGFDLGYDIKILTNLSLSHSGKKFNDAALKIIKKNLQR